MRDVKIAFDPEQILNPGKVLPDDLPPASRQEPVLPNEAHFAPASAEEAAANLAALSAARRSVRIGSAQPGSSSDAEYLLSTQRLGGVHKFAPDDLYVTVGAGMLLGDLDAYLAEHKLQVAPVSPWPAATVGGLLAANVNSPQRMRYGSWRDNLLCATLVLADGRVLRAGRPVVKNVAGYDLAKVLVGSFGTLGLLTDATLKLMPLPRLRRTLRVRADEVAQGFSWLQSTAPLWLMTAGAVLIPHEEYAELVLTVEGLPEDVLAEEAELHDALRRAGAKDAAGGDAPTAVQAWQSYLERTDPSAICVRAGVPPQHMSLYWSMVPETVRSQTTWLFDAASGLAYARFASTDAMGARRWLEALRQPALSLRGYAVVMSMPDPLAGALDIWGFHSDGLPIMRRLKQRWDPAGILTTPGFIVD